MRSRCLALVVGVLATAATGGCERGEAPPSLAELRQEVATLRARAREVMVDDTLPGAGWGDSQGLYVGLSTEMVRNILTEAARAYLGEVRLHLQPNAVVREGDEVRVHLGPIGVTAGRWSMTLLVERVDAVLRADSVLLSVVDSTHLGLRVPVRVEEATGDVLLDFTWDAARVAGLVCGDFQVHERFSGVMDPRTIVMDGRFELESGAEGTVAQPVVSQRIPINPRPTAESWERVRAILQEQDKLSNCGLAMSAEAVEERLRGLLAKGFSFPLPSSILRPVPLPTSWASEVEVAGRRGRVEVEPAPPILSSRWLWFGGDVVLEGEP